MAAHRLKQGLCSTWACTSARSGEPVACGFARLTLGTIRATGPRLDPQHGQWKVETPRHRAAVLRDDRRSVSLPSVAENKGRLLLEAVAQWGRAHAREGSGQDDRSARQDGYRPTSDSKCSKLGLITPMSPLRIEPLRSIGRARFAGEAVDIFLEAETAISNCGPGFCMEKS